MKNFNKIKRVRDRVEELHTAVLQGRVNSVTIRKYKKCQEQYIDLVGYPPDCYSEMQAMELEETNNMLSDINDRFLKELLLK